MIHPIVDFQILYPHAFLELIDGYRQSIEKYKHGSFICPECDAINPVYYNSTSESYKPIKENSRDLVEKHCENCGYKELRKTYHECLVCDKRFVGREESLYCSNECFVSTSKNGENVKCDICKKKFYKQNSSLKRTLHNYCSQDCYKTTRIRTEGYKKTPIEFKKGDVIKNRFGAYRILKIYHLTLNNSNVDFPKIKVTFTDGKKIHYARYRVDSKRRYKILGL